MSTPTISACETDKATISEKNQANEHTISLEEIKSDLQDVEMVSIIHLKF